MGTTESDRRVVWVLSATCRRASTAWMPWLQGTDGRPGGVAVVLHGVLDYVVRGRPNLVI